MHIITLPVPELGNRTYIVHDGSLGIVIDPSRRYREVLAAADRAGIQVAAVFDTHIHNDYVSGGYTLAKKLSVSYYIAQDEEVRFEAARIAPRETIEVGTLSVTAFPSPGHTPHHLSYYVQSERDDEGVLFSGGSLLYGAVGRTDLISPDATEALANAQYETAQLLQQELAACTRLYPTHGFGSFCAAMPSSRGEESVSTLADEATSNPVFTATNKKAFVAQMLANLEDYPRYYAYMGPLNRQPGSNPTLTPPKQLTREAFLRAIHDGVVSIDIRSRKIFAAHHFPGSINIENGNDFATYVGWIIEWKRPIMLLSETAEDIAKATERLSLIGRDDLHGSIRPTQLFSSTVPTHSYVLRSFNDLSALMDSEPMPYVLDVRRDSEWNERHIPEAHHIPLHRLSERLDELPNYRPIWIHCASGYRASIGASILSGQDYDVVLIDDVFPNALAAGLIKVAKMPFVGAVESAHATLLDVRDDGEWQEAHAKGAVHIPLGALISGEQTGLNLQTPLYVYCAAGSRAGMAVHYLQQMGYAAENIGGLDDWQAAGGEIVASVGS